MHFLRGLIVWLLIMIAESIHGTLRQLFLTPLIGDFNARRLTFFTGMLLIFLLALATVRWLAAPTRAALLAIGSMWAVLTVAFEFGIGLLVMGFPIERVLEDYDISRGGLMAFGIMFLFIVPFLAHRLRIGQMQ